MPAHANYTEVQLMKKAKKLLALFLAVLMVVSCAPFASAYVAPSGDTANSDYEHYKTYPLSNISNIRKIMWSPEQGAAYVLDLLDGLLYDANLVMDEDLSVATLHLDLSSIDNAFYYIYNIVKAVTDTSDNTYLGNIFPDAGGLLKTLARVLVGMLDLGKLEDLDVSALGNQNSATGKINRATSTDLKVFTTLCEFLGDNSTIVASIATSDLDIGLLQTILVAAAPDIGVFLEDFPGAIRNLLYPLLWNEDAEEAPSGWTYDKGVQDLVDWLLIKGTGYSAEDGGKSVLGEGFEAFLPNIANYNGGASVSTISFYQLVNNAISALLSGMVGDLLLDVLVDALDIDATANDGKGNTDIMSDMLYNTIIGAIDTLLVKQNGAPPISWEKYVEYESEALYEAEDYQNYPIPQLHRLLNWLFDGGGLDAFIKIDLNGIAIQDSFMSLFKDIARLLPGLFPLLGIDVPEGLTYTADELSAKKVDDTHGSLYITFEEEEIYTEDDVDALGMPNCTYYYVADDTAVNTTDASAPNYRNPKYIREECVVGNAKLYGALIKILLNSFVDGCYFPEWAETISEVGAYALASLAARYLPQNNYFDRLDAYHYQQIGQSYTPLGATSAVTPLAYESQVTFTGKDGTSKTVTVPRAAMDIGASIGAYFLNAAFDFESSEVFEIFPSSGAGTPAVDTNFETYLFEFIMWGASRFMPVFTGKWNSASGKFEAVEGAPSTWMSQCNSAIAQYKALGTQYPATGAVGKKVNNIPADQVFPIVYNFLDQTIFKLIPGDWMPDWISNNGSAGFFNDWLLNSVINLDLQKIISLLSTNSTGELNQSTAVVLLRLIDRILGTVFGGNALLPDVLINNNTAIRNVYDTPTSVTTFEALLGGDGTGLYWLLACLLNYLNLYSTTLANTVFPLMSLLVDGMYKSKRYYDGTQIVNYIDGGNTAAVDYSNGNSTITIDKLQNYYDTWTAEVNSVPFSGKLYFTNETKAVNCAAALLKFDENGQGQYDGTETINGAVNYYVIYPDHFNVGVDATRAATFVDNATVVSERTGISSVYYIYQKLDYQTGTATVTPNYTYKADGTVDQTVYTFTNFHRAMPAANGDTLRSGANGEVIYGEGYKTFEREDFNSQNVYYHNRLENALDDTADFIDEYDSFYSSELPAAYGAWMNYFIQMQLKVKGIYDKNNDGVVDANDGDPSAPGDVYPFVASSGSTAEHIVRVGNKTWNFNGVNANTPIIAAALSYAADSDNNVTLTVNETEAFVRLAMGNINFDITPNADGSYNANSYQWSGVDAAKINTLCSAFGWTYDASKNIIVRPAFALMGNSLNGSANFGKNNNQDISLTPVSAFVLGAKNENEVRNEIQEAYVAFRTAVSDYAELIDSHYDDISWRAEKCEDEICRTPVLNTAKFMLNLTKSALYPTGVNNGRNKYYGASGVLTNKYSSASFDKFQKAYDYLDNLCDAIDGGLTITQSLITEAYQGLYAAYLGLKLSGKLADWTALLNYIDMANDILNGSLGIGENVDRTIGYTLESLANLQQGVAVAQNRFELYSASWDEADYQETVDEYAGELIRIINALVFPEGVVPSIVVNEEAVEPGDNYNFTTYNKFISEGVQDSRLLGIVTGFNEGTFLNKAKVVGDSETKGLFIATGITVDGGASQYDFVESTQGCGTGSYIYGTRNYGEQFRYYVVVYGDLNGDARIDGTDAVVVNGYIMNGMNTYSDMDYRFVAADVSNGSNGTPDGVVSSFDVGYIRNYVRRVNNTQINQNVPAELVPGGSITNVVVNGVPVEE